MLETLIQQWFRFVEAIQGYSQTVLAVKDEPTSSPPSTVEIEELKEETVPTESIRRIFQSGIDLKEGKPKSFEAAYGWFKLISLTLPSQFQTPQNLKLLDYYSEQLQLIELSHFKQTHFQASTNPQDSNSQENDTSKHFIVVEGLSGTGKTRVIESLLQQCPSVEWIQSPYKLSQFTPCEEETSPRVFPPMPAQGTSAYWEYHLYAFFAQLPTEYQTLFQYLELYRLIYQIQISSNTAFVIESYYHAFLTHGLLAEHHNLIVNNEAQMSSYKNKNALSWPFDLPVPELVLYLSSSTTTRFQRLGMSTASLSSTCQQVDDLAHMIYTSIEGPGTVGIENSDQHSLGQVFYTAIEALDYFGVYSITRRSFAPMPFARLSYPPLADEPPTAAEQPQPQQQSNENANIEYYRPNTMTIREDEVTTATNNNTSYDDVAQDHQQQQQAWCDDDYLLGVDNNWLSAAASSEESGGSFNSGVSSSSSSFHRKKSVRQSLLEPMASKDVIQSRRVSMGIYNMYTKMS